MALRHLPAAVAQHPALTPAQRALLTDVLPVEFTPAQLADLGRLAEAIIMRTVPNWHSYYAPLPWLPAARALTTDQLREEYGFTPTEITAAREYALTTDAGRLLALFSRTCWARRTRQTERLRLVAETVSRQTNTTVQLASQLAA